MFNPYQVHHKMRLEANNLRRVQSRGPNGGLQMNEGLANPPGSGNLYPAIPAELQGNETASNTAQSRNGVQTGSSGQVQPTHGATGGQDEHTGRRQYAIGGDAGGQRLPATSGERRHSVASGQRQPATRGLQQPLFGVNGPEHLLDPNPPITFNLDNFWSKA